MQVSKWIGLCEGIHFFLTLVAAILFQYILITLLNICPNILAHHWGWKRTDKVLSWFVNEIIISQTNGPLLLFEFQGLHLKLKSVVSPKHKNAVMFSLSKTSLYSSDLNEIFLPESKYNSQAAACSVRGYTRGINWITVVLIFLVDVAARQIVWRFLYVRHWTLVQSWYMT